MGLDVSGLQHFASLSVLSGAMQTLESIHNFELAHSHITNT